ncbi:MAG: nucleotidyltransferase domain-containing protein [Magnetococcales bacterium]|nr:nucleotidyltransferase domain-containing protein [Magnetococcales bacterium]
MHPLIAKHRKTILELAEKHGVYHVRVFGSMARGDAGDGSDVDFLVALGEGRDYFDMGALLMDLQDLLQRKVDLVTEKGLHRAIREEVVSMAIPL